MLDHSATPVPVVFGAGGIESNMVVKCSFSSGNCALAASFKQETADGTLYQILLKVLTLDESGTKVERTLRLYIGGADDILNPDRTADWASAFLSSGEIFFWIVYKLDPVASNYYEHVPTDVSAYQPLMEQWRQTGRMPEALRKYMLVALV